MTEPRDSLLLLKIASRGDLLLAAPTFRHLRETRPAAHLTLLVGESCVDMAEHLPFFDRVEALDDHALFAAGALRRLGAAAGLLRRMRAWRVEAARRRGAAEIVILHRDWRYALLARLAGIPVRRGFRMPRGTRFLTHPYPAGAREHHADQYLAVATHANGAFAAPAAGGAPPSMAGTWSFGPGERERGLAAAAEMGFDAAAGPWVGLGFGGGKNVKTRTDLKSWPLDRYRELATELAARGWRVAWLGDREDARALGEPPVGVNLAGRLSVAESAAVMSACSLAVANDTLLLHLAGALGVPVVGIFGPTEPEHYRPRPGHGSALWLGGEALPCAPCHRDGFFPVCPLEHACMRGIGVAEVLREVEALAPRPDRMYLPFRGDEP